MRIGIDAKWYFTGPVSTRVMLHNLLPVLFSSYPQHQWFVFLDKKDKGKDFPFKEANININYVSVPTNMLSNLFVLPHHALKSKLDVVVFQTFPGICKRASSICFIHDILFKEYPQYFTWKEKLYFVPLPFFTRKAQRIIATTNFVKDELIKYKFAKFDSVIDIVPLGVSANFKPLELHNANSIKKIKIKYNLPDDFILFVGRLNARKNIESLLRALPMLTNKSIPLVIVGKEDWKKPDFKNLITNPEIGSRILLTGGIDDDELVVLYAMAKIFCFPSFAEGFGLPPLEAMASAIPVIVSKTTSLPEICGDDAVYIDPHNPESIANAINELLENEELYYKMKSNSLHRAAKFTWAATSDKLMDSIMNSVKKQS